MIGRTVFPGIGLLIFILVLLMCFSSLAFAAPEKSWSSYEREAEYRVVKETDIPVVMRDGVVLVVDVYRPDGEGPFPVILIQTPYGKGNMGNDYLVQRGYVVVVADVRGTGGSQGTWDSFGELEQRDGYELVVWAGNQSWCDGNIGLYGASYMGLNQFFTAARRPPGLKAIFPIVPMGDSYRDIVVTGGRSIWLSFPFGWASVTGAGLVPPSYSIQDPEPSSGDPYWTCRRGGEFPDQHPSFRRSWRRYCLRWTFSPPALTGGGGRSGAGSRLHYRGAA